jgi:hypothetical protein
MFYKELGHFILFELKLHIYFIYHLYDDSFNISNYLA